MLKLANIVIQSLRAKSAYDGPGTGRGGPPGPKSRTKAWSFIKQSPMFAVDDAANLVVPAVTNAAGLFFIVDVTVSSVFAVMYVPPYNIATRANGFENSNVCGRNTRFLSDDVIEAFSVLTPEAFSMIPLSAC